jgi:hypothetical protein
MPLFVVLMKPKQDRLLNSIMIVLSNVSLLDLTIYYSASGSNVEYKYSVIDICAEVAIALLTEIYSSASQSLDQRHNRCYLRGADLCIQKP